MGSRLPAAPPVLPGFDYVRPLGTGGFADVYLFAQDMPRRSVAVKVLLQEIVAEGLLRMFNVPSGDQQNSQTCSAPVVSCRAAPVVTSMSQMRW